MQRESLKYYETRQESRQGGKIRARTGSEKNATASVECQREEEKIQLLGLSWDGYSTRREHLMKKSVKVILCLFGMNNNVPFTCRTQASSGT